MDGPRRASFSGAGLLLVVLAVAGCASAPTAGEDASAVRSRGDLRIRLRVEPRTVAPGGSLTATLGVENVGSADMVLEGVCPTLAFIHVSREGERIPVQGAGGNCFNASTEFAVASGETLTRSWQLRASRRSGEELPAGVYRAETEFLVPDLPDVAMEFTVED